MKYFHLCGQEVRLRSDTICTSTVLLSKAQKALKSTESMVYKETGYSVHRIDEHTALLFG